MDVAAGMSTVYGGLHIGTMKESGYLGLKGSALAIFSEDLASFPHCHMVNNHLKFLFQGNLMPSSALLGHPACMCCTYIHSDKLLMYIKSVFKMIFMIGSYFLSI